MAAARGARKRFDEAGREKAAEVEVGYAIGSDNDDGKWCTPTLIFRTPVFFIKFMDFSTDSDSNPP